MENVFIYIIEHWPVLSLIVGIIIGLIWVIYKFRTNDANLNDKINEKISDKIDSKFDDFYDRICDRFDLVEEKIKIVNDKFDHKIEYIENKIDDIPIQNLVVSNEYIKSQEEQHIKQIEDLMLLGGKLHSTLKKYTKLIHTDHIFIGSFHNGNSNLSGIPFCKFDIISECYCDNKVKHDHEFAPVYKDSDILRYGSLFSAILQNDCSIFKVSDEVNDMEQYEDIIWRRMLGLGIKQMGVKILRDPDNIPSGFVGAVRYDDDEMDMDMLTQCGIELERIYSINKYKQDADKE